MSDLSFKIRFCDLFYILKNDTLFKENNTYNAIDEIIIPMFSNHIHLVLNFMKCFSILNQ